MGDPTAALIDRRLSRISTVTDVSRDGTHPFVVEGIVCTEDGRPVRDAAVKAFDRDVLRREEFLGEARTDAEGRYRIGYQTGQFGVAGKRRPDLVLRVFAPQGESAGEPTRG